MVHYTPDHILPLALLAPASRAAGTYDTDWTDVGRYHVVRVVLLAGDIPTGATVTIQLRAAKTATGAGDTLIKQLTAALTDTQDNRIAEVWAHGEELANALADARYARARVVVAGGAVDCAATLEGLSPRYAPASSAVVVERKV